jgi:hypothetical protein
MGQQRAEANRINAQRSSGPRTELGKSRSKMNALKHGLSAKTIVIEGEDPREFEALRAGLEQQYESDSALMFELVERLAILFWRQRRVARFEAAIIQLKMSDCLIDGQTAIRELVDEDVLTKLARYEATLANAVNRTLHLLEALRASRASAPLAPRMIESTVTQSESVPVAGGTPDNSDQPLG